MNEVFWTREDDDEGIDNVELVDEDGEAARCYLCEKKIGLKYKSILDDHEGQLNFCPECFVRWEARSAKDTPVFEVATEFREPPPICKRCYAHRLSSECSRDGIYGDSLKLGEGYAVTSGADFNRVPVSPVGSLCCECDDVLSMSWDASPEADRYHVYHAAQNSKQIDFRKPIAITSDTSYDCRLDLEAGNHRFAVVAVDSLGQKSQPTFSTNVTVG